MNCVKNKHRLIEANVKCHENKIININFKKEATRKEVAYFDRKMQAKHRAI